MRSRLRFPELRIPFHEAGSVDLKKSGVMETHGLIPVRVDRASFIALVELLQRAARHIEPRDGDIGRLTDGERHATDLKEIRCRGESKIQVHAPFQVGCGGSVERPDSIGPSFDSEIQRLRTNPSPHDAYSSLPLFVAIDFIADACW